MSLPIRLRRAAQAEYDEAADWYESRRSGLGLRFVAAVRQVLAQVAAQPDRWPEVWPGVREAPVSRWPHCVYYQTHSDQVMVLAVFHTSATRPSGKPGPDAAARLYSEECLERRRRPFFESAWRQEREEAVVEW